MKAVDEEEIRGGNEIVLDCIVESLVEEVKDGYGQEPKASHKMPFMRGYSYFLNTCLNVHTTDLKKRKRR